MGLRLRDTDSAAKNCVDVRDEWIDSRYTPLTV